MRYWLMKTEPGTFGLEHLAAAPRSTTAWDGVRNFQARNMLRDEVRRGDQAFLYHSSCALPGIVAVMQIVSRATPIPPPSIASTTTTIATAIRAIRAGSW